MQEKTQEKSPIKQKILLFLSKMGISQYEFYQKTGITRGILGQNNGISEENITRFLAYYKEVSVEWLLTGEGEMLRNTPTAVPATQPGMGIPLIPIEAMAGFGTGEVQVLEYECDRYVVPAFKDAEFLIQVKGSSMLPKYNSGDIVACKKLPMDQLFFQWNKVYVLDTNQGALIKRVKAGSDNDHLLIVSDNANYEPFELHKNFIHSVAIVIGVIRLE